MREDRNAPDVGRYLRGRAWVSLVHQGPATPMEAEMSSYDTGYVRAESAYRAERIREDIVGRRERSRLRRSRPRRRGISIEVL